MNEESLTLMCILIGWYLAAGIILSIEEQMDEVIPQVRMKNWVYVLLIIFFVFAYPLFYIPKALNWAAEGITWLNQDRR